MVSDDPVEWHPVLTKVEGVQLGEDQNKNIIFFGRNVMNWA